jgi:hypothetical protein
MATRMASVLAPSRRAIGYLTAALMSATVWTSLAAAQGNVHPAYPSAVALPAQTVDAFLQNPQGLLRQSGDHDGRLVVQTRDLLASNPNTLEPMVNLLKIAPPNQQAAIAAGIALATRIYARTNPNFAAQIQMAAVSTGVSAAVAVSVAATNTSTATMALKPPPVPVALPPSSTTAAGGIVDQPGGTTNAGTGGVATSGGATNAGTGGVNTTTGQSTNAPTGGFAQSVSPSQ